MARKQTIVNRILEQMAWIEQCGGTLLGYIANYGDPGIPPLGENGQPKTLILGPKEAHLRSCFEPVPGTVDEFYYPYYGNGGTAIYKADMGELHRLEALVRHT
jgi:hypothetical protein